MSKKLRVYIFSSLSTLLYIFNKNNTNIHKNNLGFNALSFKCRHIGAFFAVKFIMVWKYVLPSWKMQDFWCRLANSKDFTLFSIDSKRLNSPSARNVWGDNLTSAKILVYSNKNLLFLMSYWLNCINCKLQRILLLAYYYYYYYIFLTLSSNCCILFTKTAASTTNTTTTTTTTTTTDTAIVLC